MQGIEVLRKEIEAYQPIDPLEELDKRIILSVLDDPSILYREQLLYHLTSSCWVVNKEYTKILMVYHKIYQSWSWMGGHNDGNANSYEVAKKELSEESGIKNYSVSDPHIFSLEILPVIAHKKKDKFIASHLHLNITYFFVVDEKEELKINEDETAGVGWIPIEDIDTVVQEKEMLPVYHKLLSHMKKRIMDKGEMHGRERK